jgi:valyl-tRNA synthetase
VRYWAAQARLGVDTTFDEAVLKVGARLATKLFHAARFAHPWPVPPGANPVRELDCAFVEELRSLIMRVTAALEAYDHAAALAETERFFWNRLADNYIELVKERLRGGDGEAAASAGATLRTALGVIVRLLAPFLPYVTEEIWSWAFAAEKGQPSIHRAPWPSAADFAGVPAPGDAASLELAIACLAAINKAKADAEVSMGRELETLTLAAAPETLERLAPVAKDVFSAARVLRHDLASDPALEPGVFSVREARFAARPAAGPAT